MSRFREFLSDRWFGLLLWWRYGLSRRLLVFTVAMVLAPVLVTALLFQFPRDFGDPPPEGVRSPVTLPIDSPDPLRVVPLRAPVLEVLVIGDSLVAGEEDIYREALASAGVASRFDAVVSRGLRHGWICPSGARVTGDDLPDDFSEDFSAEDFSAEDDFPTDPVDDSAPEESGSDPFVGADEEEGGPAPSSGCVRQGLEALSWYAASGSPPAAVVVALGTNDASSPARQVLERLDTLRALLERRPVFLLETATYPMTAFHARWNDTARTWCLADVSCRFVDWAGTPTPSEFFEPDGVHLNAAGSRARAAALVSVLASGY